MAFTVDAQVRVADQSSQFREKAGIVKRVDGDLHSVRLHGHGCSSRQLFLTSQLQADGRVAPFNYTLCES